MYSKVQNCLDVENCSDDNDDKVMTMTM